jgi:hypothetical protein
MQKIFGAAKQPVPAQPNFPQQQQLPQQQGNINNPPNQSTQQSPQTDPNGIVPADGNKPPESPVAKFTDLWQPPKPDESAPKGNEVSEFSPQKLMEAAGKVDFAKLVSQEDLQKIQAGGPEAVAALMNALNKTSQTVFGQSAILSQKMMDKRIAEARDEFAAQLPKLVRKQSSTEGLMAKNAAFADPAVAPVVQAVQAQLAEKYPKATSAELQVMAEEYLMGVSGMINPGKKDSSEGKSNPEADSTDWEEYLKT